MSLLGEITSINFFLSADYGAGKGYNHICTIEINKVFKSTREITAFYNTVNYPLEYSSAIKSYVNCGYYIGLRKSNTMRGWYNELTR